MLRCLGVYIEKSGLDQVLSESCVYGQATVHQIQAGSHVNRGVEAHTTLTSALLALKWTVREQEVPDTDILLKIVEDADEKVFQEALTSLGERLEDLTTAKAGEMDEFCSTYIKMVLLLLNYLRAVRVGDWLLHLSTLQEFTPFFFALNRSSYARFIPVCVSMMLMLMMLKDENPRVWEYFSTSWVVRKSQTPFTEIGCDHALEQINRKLKGEGGLIGITRSPSARTKFFLIQDEILRIKQEVLKAPRRKELGRHYRDSHPTTATNHTMTERMVNVLKINNSFYSGSDTERAALIKYQQERIKSATRSPWDVLHRLPTKSFRDAFKKARVMLGRHE